MIGEIHKIKYSLLIFCNDTLLDTDILKINKLLSIGKKVIIFYKQNKDLKLTIKNKITNFKEFEKHKFLQIYEINANFNENSFVIVDGDNINKVELISKQVLDFNFEQYKVEHSSENINIAIEAGAGTGKTTVMIDRIMYLLHMDDTLNLDEITMITFTREATQNMRHKLQEKLLIKYKLTGNKKYLRYIEQEGNMNIQTIHSFAKYMIQRLGVVSGYGNNVKIKSFKYDRQELILKVLDKYFKESENKNISKILKMPLHEFIKIVDRFWNELETKGISYEEINRLDWGACEEESNTIHEILKKIFKDLEVEFSKIKKKENAVSLKDITRELDDIIEKNKININKKQIKGKLHSIKYLFVDEFQDTDDTQIKLIQWLHKNLDLKIFVVGDIKQSIYRFRGATYTAFDILKSQIPNIVSIPLVKNYRTSKDILNKLHPKFERWNNSALLKYETQDKLIPMKNIEGRYFEKVVQQDDIKKESIKIFKEYMKKIDNGKTSKDNRVVALVRTNYQAKQIKAWCDEEGILCYVEVGGTFFTSDAVRDFISLIGAYIFVNEPVYKINLVDSPYTRCRYYLDWRELWSTNGNKDELNIKIDSILNTDKKIPNLYNEYKDKFRINPVLQVLKELIDKCDVVNNYYNQKLYELSQNEDYDKEYIEKRAQLEAKRYYKNLNKLLEIIKSNFSDDFCSLHKIYDYLVLNMNTNRDEDEVELEYDEVKESIYCMTVHKSKGLEFNTVILPMMDRRFRKKNELEILFDKKENLNIKVGWNIPDPMDPDLKNRNSYKNKYYEEELQLIEKDETSKEEARLLYVALTRAINNLVCIKLNWSQDTWSSLL